MHQLLKVQWQDQIKNLKIYQFHQKREINQQWEGGLWMNPEKLTITFKLKKKNCQILNLNQGFKAPPITEG